MRAILSCIVVAFLVTIGAATAALADPPGRVGRISLIDGSMSQQSVDQPQWVPSAVNFPVSAGQTLWTDPQSRGEIQIGGAEIRLDGETELGILRLDDESAVVRVDQGVVNIHLVVLPPGGLQVVTRAGQLDLREPGSYHIDAGRSGQTGRVELAVLDGAARLSGSRDSLDIMPGEGAVVTPEQASLTLVPAEPGDFDNWALARERREVAQQSVQYLSTDTTGYQDLDDAGRWETVPEYGTVWYPTVAADWAPYRYGHWAYVAPWGWTWIDDAPWGFAPFHYGRWVDIGDRWAWLPDPPHQRPVYAPALVVFIGGAGSPSVGWVPLGPREVFHPYYPASEAYVRRLNLAHIGDGAELGASHAAVEDHVNRRALTTVPEAAFRGGAPIARVRIEAAPPPATPRPGGQEARGVEPAAPARSQEPHGPEPRGPEASAFHPPAIPPHAGPEAQPPTGRPPQPAGSPSMAWHPPQGQQPQAERPPQATAQIQHPAQPARLAPTPQGWVRQPQAQRPDSPPPPRREPGSPEEERERR